MLENLQSHARLASLGQAALDHEFSHPSRLPSSHARGHKVILNPAFLPWVPNPWQPLVSFSRGLTANILGKPQTLQASPASASRGRKVATAVAEQLVARK